MTKKTLNKKNLERLGAEKLAELVMELVQGSSTLQRRARMELSAANGPQYIAVDVRKRFASLRRSTSFIGCRKKRAFTKDFKQDQPDRRAFALAICSAELAADAHYRY